MSRSLTIAAVQFAPGMSGRDPLTEAERWVHQAADSGAQVILLPELFAGPYFCKAQKEHFAATAAPHKTHPVVTRFARLAKELGVVLPLSIYERDGPHYYNSVVTVDADGKALGVYRKSHIPDGPGYQEKYYFRPGNTGFQVWETAYGKIGVGICWDQWFPEAARAMTLMGADVLFYPTAIGAEPHDPGLDTAARWRRAMVGHAVANTIPVIAANRVGTEDGQTFYGTSFIADHAGDIVMDLNREAEAFIHATFDLDDIDRDRAAWGFFRDRRPDLYDALIRR